MCSLYPGGPEKVNAFASWDCVKLWLQNMANDNPAQFAAIEPAMDDDLLISYTKPEIKGRIYVIYDEIVDDESCHDPMVDMFTTVQLQQATEDFPAGTMRVIQLGGALPVPERN